MEELSYFFIHKQKELEINDYTNVNESWCVTHLIFLEELIYRSKNKIEINETIS